MEIKNKVWQAIFDFVFFPARVLLSHETVEKLGLTSLRQERINICLRYARGRVLDAGCGRNKFLQAYGNGVGMDNVFYPGVDVLGSGMNLPFREKIFDSAIFNASLRYMIDRGHVLKEVNRALKDNGLILVLENTPLQIFLRHSLIIWWNEFKEENVPRLTKKEIVFLLKDNGFRFEKLIRYLYGFGKLYIASKVNNQCTSKAD